MLLPALGFQIVSMNMIAFAYGGHDSTDILTIFDYGITGTEVFERNFVPDWHVLVDGAAKLAVVLRYDTQHVCAGEEILDNHNSNIVAAIMHQKLRPILHGMPNCRESDFL
jgi:hypothetical protein